MDLFTAAKSVSGGKRTAKHALYLQCVFHGLYSFPENWTYVSDTVRNVSLFVHFQNQPSQHRAKNYNTEGFQTSLFWDFTQRRLVNQLPTFRDNLSFPS